MARVFSLALALVFATVGFGFASAHASHVRSIASAETMQTPGGSMRHSH